MLTRQEHELMNIIYDSCKGKDCCLISPGELLKMLPEKGGYTAAKLEKILRSLELDDYFDIIYSDRKGEQIYCITLHTKGVAYKRTTEQSRRNLYVRIGLTVAFAVLSFIVGRILLGIFS